MCPEPRSPKMRPTREQRADDDHRGDRVGDRHQRRVQRRRHRPDDVIADEDRQHEDRELEDEGVDRPRTACRPLRRLAPIICSTPELRPGSPRRASLRRCIVLLDDVLVHQASRPLRRLALAVQPRAGGRRRRLFDLAKFGWTTSPSRVSSVAFTSSSSKSIFERLRLLVDHRLDEGVEVLGVEREAEAAMRPGTLRWPTIFTGPDRNHLARLRPSHVAAALDREIDDHRARPHGPTMPADQPRRRAARNQRRGDDDVLLGDVRGDEFGLLGLVVRRHLLGVAARRLGLPELLVLDGDELARRAIRPAPSRPAGRPSP